MHQSSIIPPSLPAPAACILWVVTPSPHQISSLSHTAAATSTTTCCATAASCWSATHMLHLITASLSTPPPACRSYINDYVLCNSCKSVDTLLDRDSSTRIMFLRCQQCSASRTVSGARSLIDLGSQRLWCVPHASCALRLQDCVLQQTRSSKSRQTLAVVAYRCPDHPTTCRPRAHTCLTLHPRVHPMQPSRPVSRHAQCRARASRPAKRVQRQPPFRRGGDRSSSSVRWAAAHVHCCSCMQLAFLHVAAHVIEPSAAVVRTNASAGGGHAAAPPCPARCSASSLNSG